MVDIAQIPDRKEPGSVVMVRPDHFKVVDVKNPYMKGSDVNTSRATVQWEDLRDIYLGLRTEGILKDVYSVDGGDGLEDMVFCANQSLPFKNKDGLNSVVMSNMRFESRQKEVPFFQRFYELNDYELYTIQGDLLLEGMGDCIFHPFKELLWMGHGFRTSEETAGHLERIIGMKVIPLQLVSEYFYHLDTCFLPLNEKTVLLCREAFDETSFEMINQVFEQVIEISRQEAVDTFCLNTHCLYSKTNPVAVTPAGDHGVKQHLLDNGYRVIEAETSEFIKAGGSVYCMKMMVY